MLNTYSKLWVSRRGKCCLSPTAIIYVAWKCQPTFLQAAKRCVYFSREQSSTLTARGNLCKTFFGTKCWSVKSDQLLGNFYCFNFPQTSQLWPVCRKQIDLTDFTGLWRKVHQSEIMTLIFQTKTCLKVQSGLTFPGKSLKVSILTDCSTKVC